MALVDTTTAIGAVSDLLRTRLATSTGVGTVIIGRPEAARMSGGGSDRFNLFLYRVAFDGFMRNTPLDAGQVPPVWLVLHYLLTAFDTTDDSDSVDAHELLGRGIVALQELNFLEPAATDTALLSNPEPLKITFDDADAELLSKVMQGSDEKYRLAAGIQVRPVMLALQRPPEYAPVVQSIGPPATPGIVVLPSLGPVADECVPERFEAGQPFEVRGTDFAGYDKILIGTTAFNATPTARGDLTTTIPAANAIAAGAYPVSVGRVLMSGHMRTSNAVLGRLLPVVSAVAVVGTLTTVGTRRFGTFRVTGRQFGGPNASIFCAMYRDGESKILLEPDPASPPTGTQVNFTVKANQALEKGNYVVILRVNGEQATISPVLNWT